MSLPSLIDSDSKELTIASKTIYIPSEMLHKMENVKCDKVSIAVIYYHNNIVTNNPLLLVA